MEAFSHSWANRRGFTLTCPHDAETLRDDSASLVCGACGRSYPVVGGVPVLIRDGVSAFAVADYVSAEGYEGASYGRVADRNSGLRRHARRWARRLGDVKSSIRHPGEHQAIEYVRALRGTPRILIIGSGGVRVGEEGDRVMHTDVAFGPAVDAIADAHDLPFPPCSFDLVIAIAVLEHVADPQRCAGEIARVLAPGGHVYAVTPFLQPVHMGAYDFTRFTPIGHRRLFRAFDEVAGGVSLGAGSTLAWAIGGVLGAVSRARPWRRLARSLSLVLAVPLRLADRWLPNSADAAGGSWFFGRLRDGPPVSDRELVQGYRQSFGMGPEHLPTPPAAG